MRSSLYFFAIIIFALSSCDSKTRNNETESKISLIGKWHRFSRANGYTEFDIDSQYVVFFNQKVGRFKLPYRLHNDSFQYPTSQYRAKIIAYADSIFLEGNDSTTATLHKFKEDNTPFNKIPEESDSLAFSAYVEGFDKRLIKELEKAGITFNMPHPADTSYQQLLERKSVNN